MTVALVSWYICFLARALVVIKSRYTHKKRTVFFSPVRYNYFLSFFLSRSLKITSLIVPRCDVARSGHLLADLFLLQQLPAELADLIERSVQNVTLLY